MYTLTNGALELDTCRVETDQIRVLVGSGVVYRVLEAEDHIRNLECKILLPESVHSEASLPNSATRTS